MAPRTNAPADPPAAPPPPGEGAPNQRQALADAFVDGDAAQRRLQRDRMQEANAPRDWYFVGPSASVTPDTVFHRLRWGGQAVLAAVTQRQADALLAEFEGREEWNVDAEPRPVELGRSAGWKPWEKPRGYALVVRKVLRELPQSPTFRPSYDVRLVPKADDPNGYCVQKRIPPPEQIRRRLMQNLPADQRPDDEGLRRMIRKLLHKVFPLFLTREAGFLKILQRDLPERWRQSVPDVFGLEYDDKGYVSCMRSRWLRLGGDLIRPLDYAQQACELLRVLHEQVGIVHLDLRLDNFLITEDGIKLVDFGSSLRRGEDIAQSPILTKLFVEMLSASQIRRDLLRMIEKGHITSAAFANAYSPPGPAADLFSVVNNFGRLDDHGDFRGLTVRDPQQDAFLTRLRREVFRPVDAKNPTVFRLRELCHALHEEPTRARPVPLAHGAIRFDLPKESAGEEPREVAAPSLPFAVAVPDADEE